MIPAMTAAWTYDTSAAARQPLMYTFWTSRGWRGDPAWPDPEVMRGAVEAGVMFSGPRGEDHDGGALGRARQRGR